MTLIIDDIEKSKRNGQVVVYQKLDNIAEAIEELTQAIEVRKKQVSKEPEYFDKDLNKNITESIGKVSSLIEKFKQQQIDLSPITSIAAEIKNQNTSLISLVKNLANESNKAGYEYLVREVLAMVQRSNDFISKGIKQVDYSEDLKKINETIENKKRPTEWEFNIKRTPGNLIEKVTAVAKLNNSK